LLRPRAADGARWVPGPVREDPAPPAPGTCFDRFTSPGASYEIDVTRPPGGRIRNLAFRGAPLAPEQTFLVATSSFRAAGLGQVRVHRKDDGRGTGFPLYAIDLGR
jgi:hypothetical protein